MGDSSVTEMTAPVGKNEAVRDGSTSSTASSPEPEAGTYTQENPQQQKRKGGRKPIYATSEERKQRNRQAQAAFRERRTEYIKQLESTIKHHEETLQNLQQSHRSAADECLMLRYKNSLLERILLEKGIDVQAELRAKTGSPNLGPTRAPVSTISPSQAPQRALISRHPQARRSIGGIGKIEGPHGLHAEGGLPARSPLSQPTPGSHLSSPSTTATRSPNFMPQGATSAISPNFGPTTQQQQHQLRPQPPRSHFTPLMTPQRPSVITNPAAANGLPGGAAIGNGTSGAGGTGSAYYSSTFENHMNQLEQEYDEQADMLDDQEPSDQSAGPGPFPPPFAAPQMHSQTMQPPMAPTQNPPFTSPAALAPTDANGMGAVFNTMNHLFDPYDPMLDADPFGLSASMHFPTQFSYETR